MLFKVALKMYHIQYTYVYYNVFKRRLNFRDISDFIKHSACVTNSMLLITIAMKCAGIRDAITGLGSIQDAAEKYQKTCKCVAYDVSGCIPDQLT